MELANFIRGLSELAKGDMQRFIKKNVYSLYSFSSGGEAGSQMIRVNIDAIR